MSDLHPRHFDDGHALTFTVREIYENAGEFVSQHHDRGAAGYAFTLARRHASYAELRGRKGEVIADLSAARARSGTGRGKPRTAETLSRIAAQNARPGNGTGRSPMQYRTRQQYGFRSHMQADLLDCEK